MVTSESGGETAQPVGSLAHRNERAWNKIPILAALADCAAVLLRSMSPSRRRPQPRDYRSNWLGPWPMLPSRSTSVAIALDLERQTLSPGGRGRSTLESLAPNYRRRSRLANRRSAR